MEVLGRAREAQGRFERLRRRESPRTWGRGGGSCDEIVGRMCLRLQSGSDWWPAPEAEEIRVARLRLLADLERAAGALPGDRWILGQRVFYLSEAGATGEALGLSRACAPGDPAWCQALAGYVLHLEHRYPEAEEAFSGALAAMDPAEAGRVLDPRDLLDREGRELLDGADPVLRARLVERFWLLADPLFLVEGNDRRTEHLSRHVVARIRAEAVTPYQLRWGDDLEETLVRYGWEVGWEQVQPAPGSLAGSAGALGHHHPESRDHVPPGAALARLPETGGDDWNPAGRRAPRTGYAPAYAPVFLPADAEIFRVPRGDTLVLVARLGLPEDTTWHSGHGHAPLPAAEAFRGRASEAGLFAWREGEDAHGVRVGGTTGILRLPLLPGRYLVSAEVWAPDSARAGRLRRGLSWEGIPRDVPALSDLLLADPGDPEPSSLDGVLPRLRRGTLEAGGTVRVAWELSGLGWRDETLRYHLDVVAESGGILRRVGRFLRLVGDRRAVTLSWEEPGPGEPAPHFRSARITLPADLPAGMYRIRLRMESVGRETVEVQRLLEVLPPSR